MESSPSPSLILIIGSDGYGDGSDGMVLQWLSTPKEGGGAVGLI